MTPDHPLNDGLVGCACSVQFSWRKILREEECSQKNLFAGEKALYEFLH
jgi:hypothetical protein